MAQCPEQWLNRRSAASCALYPRQPLQHLGSSWPCCPSRSLAFACSSEGPESQRLPRRPRLLYARGA
eukprot:scaffold3068_cov401-Prasinococcus_capsulatus_cf.AAC.2